MPLISFESNTRKKYKKFQVQGHFAHKCKTSEGICKTSCWLTEKFDERGKLINVMQFRRVIEVLLISGGNWRNLQFQRIIAYLLKNKDLKGTRVQIVKIN